MRLILSILKWLGLLILVAAIGFVSLPWAPVFLDQVGKSKYENWLEKTGAPLRLDEADSDFAFANDFYENRFILLGEVHGFEMVQRLDFVLLKHLRARVNRPIWYLAEIPPHVARDFNTYVLGGSDEGARRAFDDWSAADQPLQWGNRNFFDKLTAIRALNATLADEMKIRFIGVDKPGADALKAYSEFAEIGDDPISLAAPGAEERVIGRLAAKALQRGEEESRYRHILPNIKAVSQMEGFEDALFYGLWGQFHSVRTSVNGVEPLAAQLNGPGGVFEGGVGIISTLCVNQCKNMMPAGAFPGLPTPPNGEDYIQLPLSHDQTYLFRARGIGELKSATDDEEAALFRLAGEGSPYQEGKRVIKMSGYLSLMQQFEIEGPPAAAFDYVVVMQGSEALTPWRGEAWDMQ